MATSMFAGITDAGAAGFGYGGVGATPAGGASPAGTVSEPGPGGSTIPVCGVLALSDNSQTITCVIDSTIISASTAAGTFHIGEQLVLGDSSSVPAPTGYTTVASVFLGVYDSTGVKLTSGFANAIEVTLASPSIVPGDVVQAEINGAWQIIKGASVIKGVAKVSVGSDPAIEVTSPPPTKGATPAGSVTKKVNEPTIAYGSVGAAVKLAQELLDKSGADLVIDGIFGPLTEAATKAFQSAHGLSVDGIIGPLTWKKLL